MSEGRHVSIWLDGPELAPPHPALDGERRADVAVVGGGITGLTTALLLAATGAPWRPRPGPDPAAARAGHTAKVTSQHGADLRPRGAHGGRGGAPYGAANEAAKEPIAALVAGRGDRLRLPPPRRLLYAATTPRGASSSARPRRRPRSRPAGRAGRGRAAAVRDAAARALQTPGRVPPARVPARRSRGTCRRARGRIFEHTRAVGRTRVAGPRRDGPAARDRRPRRDRDADAVPRPRLASSRALTAKRSYVDRRAGSPARRRRRCSSAAARRRARSARSALDGGEELLLVGGEGHTIGSADAEPERYERLEEFAREHWDVARSSTAGRRRTSMPADQRPLRRPAAPALEARLDRRPASTKWGMTGGTAAARADRGRGSRRASNADAPCSRPRAHHAACGQAPKLVTENAQGRRCTSSATGCATAAAGRSRTSRPARARSSRADGRRSPATATTTARCTPSRPLHPPRLPGQLELAPSAPGTAPATAPASASTGRARRPGRQAARAPRPGLDPTRRQVAARETRRWESGRTRVPDAEGLVVSPGCSAVRICAGLARLLLPDQPPLNGGLHTCGSRGSSVSRF